MLFPNRLVNSMQITSITTDKLKNETRSDDAYWLNILNDGVEATGSTTSAENGARSRV
jgi:hypothetical protein